MQSNYSEPFDKIWLALTSFQEAKTQMVADFGVGEEMPFNIYGWRHDVLTAVCRVLDKPGRSKYDKLGLMFYAAEEIRSTWGATAFTMMNEGFCLRPGCNGEDDWDLPAEFARGNVDVLECLTAVHIEPTEIYAVASPYKYLYGREVAFGEPLFYDYDNSVGVPGKFRDILTDTPVSIHGGTSLDQKVEKTAELDDLGIEVISF